MTFAEALEQMKKGAKAKLPHWRGYLTYNRSIRPNVRLHDDNGADVTKTEMDYVAHVFDCLAAKDWLVIPGEAQEEPALFDFAEAIRIVKAGGKIARKGWNGKGMYVFLADDVEFHTAADIGELEGLFEVGEMLVMRTAAGTLQPGWLASQADMLAEDWMFA